MLCKQGLSGIPQPSDYLPKLFISFACDVVTNRDIAIRKMLLCGVE